MEIILICNDCWQKMARCIGEMMLIEEPQGL